MIEFVDEAPFAAVASQVAPVHALAPLDIRLRSCATPASQRPQPSSAASVPSPHSRRSIAAHPHACVRPGRGRARRSRAAADGRRRRCRCHRSRRRRAADRARPRSIKGERRDALFLREAPPILPAPSCAHSDRRRRSVTARRRARPRSRAAERIEPQPRIIRGLHLAMATDHLASPRAAAPHRLRSARALQIAGWFSSSAPRDRRWRCSPSSNPPGRSWLPRYRADGPPRP